MKKSTQKKLLRYAVNFIKKPSYLLIFAILALIFWEYYGKDMGLKEYVKGEIRVVDGDTIAVNNKKIRLKGMDAPEISQKCTYTQNKQKTKYNCGINAKLHLISIIKGKELECTNEGDDMYGRRLAYCYADGTNINRKMVLDGWAVSYNKEFMPEEVIAKAANRGIWSGEFINPKNFRKKHNKRSAK